MRVGSGLRASASALSLSMVLASAAIAQDVKSVPRNRTLISQGWDYYNQVPAPTNFNPYSGPLLHQRNSLHYTVAEFLFYPNHNTGEITPWQAESFRYNDGFTELTVKLRDKVAWSDGKPFTADDVVFTIDMLKSVAPDLVLSSAVKEWVAKAEALDPLTVRITLNKPGPRFARDMLADGAAGRLTIVPKHVWSGQDPRTFTFYDPQKGWPLGTGPYKVVKSDSGSILYDRRDGWWALDAKLVDRLPGPERIVYKPATVDAMPQLFTNNELDVGRALQVGAFEAAKARNPGLVSWNKAGPVWGAPDGCTFRLVFNAQKPPFDKPAVRRAFNAAINRDEIVDLAYEGSMPKTVLPFSSYGGMKAYTDKLGDLVAGSGVGTFSLDTVKKLLSAEGFTNTGGTWSKPGGGEWPVTILTQQGNPIAPVITQELKKAGFNTVFQAVSDAAFADATNTGNFETALAVHCGSIYDPWQTLEHFHSKYVADEGKKGSNPRALTRYKNPKLDALLNKMEAVSPSPEDADYMALVREATQIYLQDMPQVTLAEEQHVVTFNTTYWSGYPSAQDPYVAPYLPWEGFARVIHRLKATR
jgi:peptide/nickel transport system substrate-binding protein